MMTGHEKDEDGNYIHRLVADGQISPLEFFEASGMPVYRMRVQLRMARGLFDMVAKTIYANAPFSYGPNCGISQPRFKIGRDLEEFIQRRFRRDHWLKRPRNGELSPLFIHCQDSEVLYDSATGAKSSEDQVRVALDFAKDFVASYGAVADKITFLAPYLSNVRLLDTIKKEHSYHSHLSGSPGASTIDGYQGRYVQSHDEGHASQ